MEEVNSSVAADYISDYRIVEVTDVIDVALGEAAL
jgi:hypothetical protein